MGPGRDLDALIAGKVMDVFVEHDKVNDVYYSPGGLKNYSTDIAAAWEVVEKMTQNQKSFEIGFDESNGEVRVHFKDQGEPGSGYHEEVGGLRYLPHAICLAALKAVGYDF